MEIDVLGENIRKIINRKKITQIQLGEHIGADQSQISRWLMGKNSMQIETFLKIVEFTQEPFSSFVEGVINYRDGSLQVYGAEVESIENMASEPVSHYYSKDPIIEELAAEIKALKRQMRDVQKKLSEMK